MLSDFWVSEYQDENADLCGVVPLHPPEVMVRLVGQPRGRWVPLRWVRPAIMVVCFTGSLTLLGLLDWFV